jgi:probable phosphoglycerate mutase
MVAESWFYFARHGESEANILREFSNRGTKHGLTEKGREQAATLANKLADAQVSRILTSPLMRARESATIVGGILGVPVEVADALREWDVGILEGRHDDAAWERYWKLRKNWTAGKHEDRIEGGESLLDVTRRFVPFVRDLAMRAVDGERQLLISHGGIFSAALPFVLTNVDPSFAEQNGIDNASFIVAKNTGGVLRCVEWGGGRVDH